MDIYIAATVQADSCYEDKLLFNALVREIKEVAKNEGHRVDSFMLPYAYDLISLPEDITAFKLVDTRHCDKLITVGYPACFISHQNKSCFLFQANPKLNEYFGMDYGIYNNSDYARIKEIVHNAEKGLKYASKVVTGSMLLANDIQNRLNISTETFYIGDLLTDDDIYKDEESKKIYDTFSKGEEKYFIIETDLYPEERIDELLLPIYKELNLSSKLLIAMPRSGRILRKALNDQIKDLRLEERVILLDNYATKSLIKGANAYLSLAFERRKISMGVMRACESGSKILSLESASMQEVASFYDGVELLNIEAFKNALLKYDKNSSDKKGKLDFSKNYNIKALAKGLIG